MHISIPHGWAVSSWALAVLATVTKAAGAFLPGIAVGADRTLRRSPS